MTVAIAFVGFASVATRSDASSTTKWYWTPGLCKTNLQTAGMQIDDGRTFNVAKAFCVGWGGTTWCEWSSGYRYRLYAAFTVYARSYDGVVRQFNLYTRGKDGYRAEHLKVL